VLLPSGHLHGRLADASVLLSSADRGTLQAQGWRGRSTWPAQGQVAEETVRRAHDIAGLDDLVVSGAGDDWHVRHRDGRSWSVRVTAQLSGERAESCGKELKPVGRHTAELGPTTLH
jgi:hypothetical protein